MDYTIKGNDNIEVVGIVPAAGLGTRLAPLPFSKELFPLGYQEVHKNGIPQWRPKVVSQYTIDQMVKAGVTKIFVVLGSGKLAIMEYFGNGSRIGVDIVYLFQEKMNGMPFALNLAHSWLHDEIVLFGMPDTIIYPDDAYAQMLQSHISNNSDLTLGVFLTDNPYKYGMVEFDDRDRLVRNIDKPQRTNLKYMWGMACWSDSFTKLMSEYLKGREINHKEVVLSEVFQAAVDGELDARVVKFDSGEYLDIGTVEGLQYAIERLSISVSFGHS